RSRRLGARAHAPSSRRAFPLPGLGRGRAPRALGPAGRFSTRVERARRRASGDRPRAAERTVPPPRVGSSALAREAVRGHLRRVRSSLERGRASRELEGLRARARGATRARESWLDLSRRARGRGAASRLRAWGTLGRQARARLRRAWPPPRARTR